MRVRAVSIAAGVALIALAFAAATRVADTRDGLIAEVITLLGGLAGVSLLLFCLLAEKRATSPAPRASRSKPATAARSRPVRDLLAGGGGLLLALFLLGGLAVSGGPGWAALGSILLLPMVAGSVYLCVRFARTRRRARSAGVPSPGHAGPPSDL